MKRMLPVEFSRTKNRKGWSARKTGDGAGAAPAEAHYHRRRGGGFGTCFVHADVSLMDDLRNIEFVGAIHAGKIGAIRAVGEDGMR